MLHRFLYHTIIYYHVENRCVPPDDIMNLKRLRRVLRRLWFFHLHIKADCTVTWRRKGLSPTIVDRDRVFPPGSRGCHIAHSLAIPLR